MRMVFTQHIADHTGALDWLGTRVAVGAAKPKAHALHTEKNAALNRLLSIAYIGQGSPLDHTQCVFELSTLGILG